ncbi:hypothetical protein M6D93_12485 [Jatrophihabitans telluris]|uniref:Uncharacterized protein n=1 Tax=Jatrophihabitans telluris TaxID=2038343 RepID=A0ABY4QUZ4_9ACTN|nr:hypothetical protein [Jatrophihabitans telluris]UQX87118.1 hypothetical protein M6D93_12485 [Jatrophihabitans telluris]
MGILISLTMKLMFFAVHMMILMLVLSFWFVIALTCLVCRQRVPRMPRLGLPHL